MRLTVMMTSQLSWAIVLLCLSPSEAEDVLAEDPLGSRFRQQWRRQLVNDALIRTVTASSVLQCSMRCLGLEQCKAANFRPLTGTGSDTGSDAGNGNCDLLGSQGGEFVTAGADAVSLLMPGSCRMLRRVRYLKDGVYRHRGLPAPLYCDMTYNSGGWTLMTTSVSNEGWTLDYVIERRRDTPGLDINYSILGLGEQILSVGTSSFFRYRLEVGGRQRWGGIWRAPRRYTLTGSHSNQTENIQTTKTFDDWHPIPNQTPLIMVPWVNRGGAFGGGPLLTMCDEHGQQWFGTIVTAVVAASHGVSPWIQFNEESKTGARLYWIRESYDMV